MITSTLATFIVRGETCIRVMCLVCCVLSGTYFFVYKHDMYAVAMEIALFSINAFYLMRGWIKDANEDHEVDKCSC